MDRLYIYNVALSVFNIQPLSEDDLEDTEGHPEVQILDLFLQNAIEMVLRERNWTFLEQKLELGEDLGPEAGYGHSYKLPTGLFRLTRADGIYRVVGTRLLTNGTPYAYGIMSELPDDGVPKDFYGLVGFALAILASSKLSAGDTKTSTASAIYQKVLVPMIMNDVQDSIHQNRSVANGDGPYV